MTVLTGDCLALLPTIEAGSVDAIVCDPPYGLGFMGVKWDTYGDGKGRKPTGKPTFDQVGGNSHARKPGGVELIRMKENRRFQEQATRWAEAMLRVAKPGAHLVAFGGTRTYHRLTCAIEDAGWEIRDCLSWLYAQGFPKSLDVSKAMDKAAGAEREVLGPSRTCTGKSQRGGTFTANPNADDGVPLLLTAPSTDLARQWSGWGTALKPAWEPIILARKPLAGTVAANVAARGTGALNVDGCRIANDGENDRENKGAGMGFSGGSLAFRSHDGLGRWPANVVLDPDAAAMLDEQSGERPGMTVAELNRGATTGRGLGFGSTSPQQAGLVGYGDTGGASRFFYMAKASKAERLEYLSCDCETPIFPAWENEARNRPAPTRSTSRGKAISEDASTGGRNSLTLPLGSECMGEGPEDSRSTTSTATSRTIASTTSGSSAPPSTSASIAGVSCATASGGSPAASADHSSQSAPMTGTSPAKAGRSTGVAVPATSRGSSETSNCGGCGKPFGRTSHPTQKPVALMRWLCRLVTPPGGLILDPFTGSGTTGIAAALEGFRFLGIEREPEYVAIATARIAKATEQPTLWSVA